MESMTTSGKKIYELFVAPSSASSRSDDGEERLTLSTTSKKMIITRGEIPVQAQFCSNLLWQ
ncbi:BTE_HP_G0222000.mRNA.1.CDS.1 [Saccharomyces cerevisiae]|nr:BTE_HP_G0222000.mRNA.1.CDS.1 [Saccharomyces cerevisiae]CAI6436089.1 BTE_HP_G0222000.mRNA.1.CDS.1 [Saccharomyces cerevisiae]